MCLNVSLIVLKISKSSLSGSILINLQSNSCSIAFCLLIWQSIFLSLCLFSSFFFFANYSHENSSQSYNLKLSLHCVCKFFPSNELIIFVSTDCSFVEMTSYCLDPNFVLNLRTYVVLQPIS